MAIDKAVWGFLEGRFGSLGFTVCGHGWRDLIYKLVQDLDKVWEGFESNKWKPSECWHINQIKEKYATLSFYAGVSIIKSEEDSPELKADFEDRCKRFMALIEEAESQSSTICEGCGKPGEEVNTGSWLKTLCKICLEKKKGENK